MHLPSLTVHRQTVEQMIDELRDRDAAVTSAKERIARLADELATAQARLDSARSALALCAEDDIPCRQRAEQEIEGAKLAVDRLERERSRAEEAERTARRTLRQALIQCENLARELDADLKKANEQVEHFKKELPRERDANLKAILYQEGEAAQAAAEGLAELVNRLYMAIAGLQHGDTTKSGSGMAATVLGLLGATLGFVSAGLGGSVVGGLAGLVFGKVASSSNDTSRSGAGEQPVAKAARMDFAPSGSPAVSTGDRGMKPPFEVEAGRLESSSDFYATPLFSSFLDNGMDYRATEFAAFSSEAPEALVIPPPPSPPSLEAMQAPQASTFGERPSPSTFGEVSMDSLGYTPVTLGGAIPPSPVTLGGAMPASPVTLGSVMSPSPVTLGSTMPAPSVTLGGVMSPSPVTLGSTMPSSSVTLGSALPATPTTLGDTSPLFGASSF